MSAFLKNTSSDNKHKAKNPAWMDYKDISNLAVEDNRHHLCDTVLNITFTCNCENDKNPCKYIDSLRPKNCLTKKYLLWSGSLFRSSFFSKSLLHKISLEYYMKIDSTRAEWKIPTLSHVFDITNRDCSTYYAFDLLVYLICKLHGSIDITNYIDEIAHAISAKTIEMQRALDLIEHSHILYTLADEFTFPLVAQFSLLLSFKFIEDNCTIKKLPDSFIDKNTMDLFPQQTTSMEGIKEISYTGEKCTNSTLTDRTFIDIFHNPERCSFCTFDKQTLTNNKQENGLQHYDNVKAKLNFIGEFKKSIIPHMTNKQFSHKLPLSNPNVEQRQSIQPIGYLFNGRAYILNSKIVCTNDSIKKQTEIACYFYVSQNTQKAKHYNTLQSQTRFIVSFYSDDTGFFKIPLDINLSKFSRCDIINNFLCNRDLLHTKITMHKAYEKNECVLSKITKCFHSHAKTMPNVNEKYDSLNSSSSMDYHMETNIKTIASTSFLQSCPSPNSSSSSFEEDDDDNDTDIISDESYLKDDRQYLYISFDILT